MRRGGRRTRRAPTAAVALAVALLTAGVFLPVKDNAFVIPDDDQYVSANPQVAGGLTLRSVVWAFTTVHMGIWHPLTWLSHMADASLFGLRPPGHHLVGAGLHAAAAAVLFLALAAATGARWGPAFAALLFAVHPLRVESVAWAAERKDVLMGLFWMLTLLAHVRAVRRPSRPRRVVVAALFVCALLAKPAAVTLPVALLLLDFWPLGRLPRGQGGRALLEKAPLFALAAASSLVALRAQQAVGATVLTERTALALRLANAVDSVGAYVLQTLWPASLAHFYPFPERGLPSLRVAGAALLCAAATAGAWSVRSRRPWLSAGWGWFLLTLLPMAGIVQIGLQARADRYTYLPAIGLSIALAWELRSVAARPGLRVPAAALAILIPLALAPVTSLQIGFWKDGVTLAERALAVAGDSWFVENNLGAELARRGRHVEALERFRRALRLKPGDARALNNMGISLAMLGRTDEAAGWLAHAPNPDFPDAVRRSGLRWALGLGGNAGPAGAGGADGAEARLREGNRAAFAGRLPEAEGHFRAVLALDPTHVHAHHNLGSVLRMTGRSAEAEEHFREAVRLFSGFAPGRISLGVTLAERSAFAEAEAQLREAIALDPSKPDAWYDLALVLVEQGRAGEAIRPLEESLRLNPASGEAQDLLERLREPRSR